MRFTTNHCLQLTKNISKSFKGNNIKVYVLLFFAIFCGANLFAQNCAKVNGPSRVTPGAANQTYTQVTCDPNTSVWTVTNNGTNASIVGSNTGESVIVNPGTLNGTYTVNLTVTSTDRSDMGSKGIASRSTAVRKAQ